MIERNNFSLCLQASCTVRDSCDAHGQVVGTGGVREASRVNLGGAPPSSFYIRKI
jgi:hypothetical protein